MDENLADQGGCPTIDEALSMVRERARLAHLAGEDIGLEVDFEKARHLYGVEEPLSGSATPHPGEAAAEERVDGRRASLESA